MSASELRKWVLRKVNLPSEIMHNSTHLEHTIKHSRFLALYSGPHTNENFVQWLDLAKLLLSDDDLHFAHVIPARFPLADLTSLGLQRLNESYDDAAPPYEVRLYKDMRHFETYRPGGEIFDIDAIKHFLVYQAYSIGRHHAKETLPVLDNERAVKLFTYHKPALVLFRKPVVHTEAEKAVIEAIDSIENKLFVFACGEDSALQTHLSGMLSVNKDELPQLRILDFDG